MKILLFPTIALTLLFPALYAQTEPDWSLNASIRPGETRENIYQLPKAAWEQTIRRGYIHALQYPVKNTGLLLPFNPIKNYFIGSETNPLRKLVFDILGDRLPFRSIEGMYDWLGVYPYPQQDPGRVDDIPYPFGERPDYPMGASFYNTPHGKAFTFSCTTCHAMEMFGQPIIGLTNKIVRANLYFDYAKKILPLVPAPLFKLSTKATKGEVKLFKRAKWNMRAIGGTVPQVLGLDTSLSQVALSLARRNPDEAASRSRKYEVFPRKNELENFVADSKPAVWWNLKYKTRWLSDGSVVSGNPIFTNFLWNELGRGSDLDEMGKWMEENQTIMRELTAAVFATQSPRFEDFFGLDQIDLERAKKGEIIYSVSCAQCHGAYEKGWSYDPQMSKRDQIQTVKVFYHDKTPVIDVGTDPQRYQGMRYFSEGLNRLKISKRMNTVVSPQQGYVPNPMDGIWARYPYMHNNSMPTLCDVLSKQEERTPQFYQGPAKNSKTDFDFECVGYPVGDQTPEAWKQDEAYFDTTKPGLTNTGHTSMFIDDNGNELLTPDDKKNLIEFLKTL